jgi:hypothetical protein
MPRIRAVVATAIIITQTVLAPAHAAAQTTTIKVIDSDSHPVPFAWVVVHSGPTGIANERGELSLGNTRDKTIAVDVRRIGYQPWSGKLTLPDSTSTQTVTLAHLAQPITGMTINASAVRSALESEGFYTRWLAKQQGEYRNATFIGPEMIEARNAPLTTDLLDRALDVNLRRDARGAIAVMGTGRSPLGSGEAACYMNVLVDGGPVCPPVGCHYVFAGDPPGTSNEDHTIDINKAISPKQVAAIEVYPRQDGMPPIVRDLWNGCGIILIWTATAK